MTLIISPESIEKSREKIQKAVKKVTDDISQIANNEKEVNEALKGLNDFEPFLKLQKSLDDSFIAIQKTLSLSSSNHDDVLNELTTQNESLINIVKSSERNYKNIIEGILDQSNESKEQNLELINQLLSKIIEILPEFSVGDDLKEIAKALNRKKSTKLRIKRTDGLIETVIAEEL